jgi:hypothetical protein
MAKRKKVDDPITDARGWLRASGYAEVADRIDSIIAKWAKISRKTRRNWWDILSGDKAGKPREVDGVSFPVIAAAQRRMGKPVTKGALSKAKEKPLPDFRNAGRWTDRSN